MVRAPRRGRRSRLGNLCRPIDAMGHQSGLNWFPAILSGGVGYL